MKNWKHCIFIGILTILIFCFAFGCNGSKRLSGTWKINDSTNYGNAAIEFKGNNFLITQYPVIRIDRYRDGTSSESWGRVLPFVERINRNALVLLREENYVRDGVSFYYRDETKGTYSISDNKIELSFEEGSVKVLNFSRTENTITIDHLLFVQRK